MFAVFQPMRRQGAASSACRAPSVPGGFLRLGAWRLSPPRRKTDSCRLRVHEATWKVARQPLRSRGGCLRGAAVGPSGSLGAGGAGAWGQGGYWRRPCLCGARRGYALNCSLDLQRAGAQPPPSLADLIFCTVADSCRIVAGQLPDSCRLFFTQLPSFWSEKSKFCKINPFSNQNDGNCLKNMRQLCKNRA